MYVYIKYTALFERNFKFKIVNVIFKYILDKPPHFLNAISQIMLDNIFQNGSCIRTSSLFKREEGGGGV